MNPFPNNSPHRQLAAARGGVDLQKAKAALILVHGRGATAESILTLQGDLDHPDFAFLAPQAAGNTWYPQSFLAPLENNEPGLSSGLEVLTKLTDEVEAAGIPASRTLLLGFSQGACLTLEFLARRPRAYGGVLGFTGGLIGPPDTPRDYPGSLAGTPVFLGSGDPDPHVPWSRVQETAAVLGDLGAEVTLQRYPGMPHTVNSEEISFARSLMEKALDH